MNLQDFFDARQNGLRVGSFVFLAGLDVEGPSYGAPHTELIATLLDSPLDFFFDPICACLAYLVGT